MVLGKALSHLGLLLLLKEGLTACGWFFFFFSELPGDVAFLDWSAGFIVLGIEPRGLCVLGRLSAIEPQQH